jgi:hypothetical protein
MGGAELAPRVNAPVHATQPLAVAQAGAGVVDDDAGALQVFDGFDEKAVRELIVGQ